MEREYSAISSTQISYEEGNVSYSHILRKSSNHCESKHTARQIQLHHIASLVSEDDIYISSSNRSGLVVKAVVIYERDLGKGPATKSDDFRKNSKRPSTPSLPHFRKITLQIFYNGYGCIYMCK